LMDSLATLMRSSFEKWPALFYEFLWQKAPLLFSMLNPKTMPFPRNIEFEVSTGCNINCSMCQIHSELEGFEKNRHMPLSTFTNVIDETHRYLDTVFLWGLGEPFTNPRFLDMVEIAKGKGLKVVFSTNATMLTERVSRELIRLGVDSIIFSIDGATASTFNSIRSGADFDTVTRNIKRLKELKEELSSQLPRVSINSVLLKENLSETPGIVHLAAELGADEVKFQNILCWDQSTYEKSILTMDRQLINSTFDEITKNAGERGLGLRLPNLEVGVDQHCKFVFFGPPYIRWDGTVTICSWIAYPLYTYFILEGDGIAEKREYFEPHVMGNIHEASIRSIWNNYRYREVRRNFLQHNKPNPCSICLHQHQIIC